MAANETGWLLFAADVTADRRMSSDVRGSILSAHIQPNAAELSGCDLTAQMDNDIKHTVTATQYLFLQVLKRILIFIMILVCSVAAVSNS